MKVSSLELFHVGRHALGSDAQWTKVFSLVLWNILVAAVRVRSNSFEMCKRSWPWRHTTFSAGADGSPHWVSTVASAASSVDAALPVETSFCSSPSTAATSGVTVAIVRRELSEAVHQRPKSLWYTEKLRQHRKSTNTKNTFLIHTRFLLMDSICWETHACFLPCVYFFPGNTCAFPVYDGNTSRFQTRHVSSGNTFLIHTRFQVKCYASDCKHICVSVLDSIFGKNTCAFPICLCFFAKNTCAFPLCFSLFARNTCAFPTSPISSRDVCIPHLLAADPQRIWSVLWAM